MENIFFGVFTGGSLILAIGPQNLFVIEQGLKRNYVFLVTTLCTLSDIFLIFLGIYIYHLFSFISFKVELTLNLLLILFLSRYIYSKYTELNKVHRISVPKSNKNFKELVQMLNDSKISYSENPFLVRGLDYYNDFTFEIVPENSKGSQDALGGGGQYDNLSKLLGGKDNNGVGVAFGVDRIMELS